MKIDQHEVKSLSKNEITLLLKAPDVKTFVGFRNYVLMITLLDTGCRISELLAIDEENVIYKMA